MSKPTLKQRWEALEDNGNEFLEFKKIKNPPSKRPDLCAFILLDKLLPGTDKIVSASEHDEIWLATDCDKLHEVATDEDLLYLIHCGIYFDESNDSLGMFA